MSIHLGLEVLHRMRSVIHSLNEVVAVVLRVIFQLFQRLHDLILVAWPDVGRPGAQHVLLLGLDALDGHVQLCHHDAEHFFCGDFILRLLTLGRGVHGCLLDLLIIIIISFALIKANMARWRVRITRQHRDSRSRTLLLTLPAQQ